MERAPAPAWLSNLAALGPVTGGGCLALAFPATRPNWHPLDPRPPLPCCLPAGGRKASNFYPSSLPKGGHSQSRSRPFGQSPPSVSVGECGGNSWADELISVGAAFAGGGTPAVLCSSCHAALALVHLHTLYKHARPHPTLRHCPLPPPLPRLAAGLLPRQRQRAAGQLPRFAPRLPPHGQLAAGQVRRVLRLGRPQDQSCCCSACKRCTATLLGAAQAAPRRASTQHVSHSHSSVPPTCLPAPRPRARPRSSAPIPKFQHPSHSLLEENGFTQIKYEKFYARCIQVRGGGGLVMRGVVWGARCMEGGACSCTMSQG